MLGMQKGSRMKGGPMRQVRGRARGAYDALRGRNARRRPRWGMLAAAAAAGAAATWAATRLGRRTGESDPFEVPEPAKEFIPTTS